MPPCLQLSKTVRKILHHSLIFAVDRTFIVNGRRLSLAKPCGDLIILSMRHHVSIMINHGSRKEKDIRSQDCSKVHSLWIHETVRIIVEEASRKKRIFICIERSEFLSLPLGKFVHIIVDARSRKRKY